MDDLRERLAAREVTEPIDLYVLAALSGDLALDAVIGGVGPGPAESPNAAEQDIYRAGFLHRIRVRGFRGIGPEADLDLTPGAGLTLVVGRNGSGKSSFAEAAEFALTGSNARWEKRSKVWKDGWRNLHAPQQPRISAEFVVDGQIGPTVVERSWTSEASLDEGSLSVRTPTGSTSLDALGWKRGLELYRPFLPYSELGAMVDEGPTALHDALAAVLGLDELTSGVKLLKDARLGRERAWKGVAEEGNHLAGEVDELEDERAGKAAAQLRAKRPNFEVLGRLVAGTGEVDRSLQLLRDLTGVRGPDLDAVRTIAHELEEVAASTADHQGTDAARDLEVADLLARARAWHGAHGDGRCPVCGAGQLDGSWADAARTSEQELREAAIAVQQVQRRLSQAEAAVRQLVGPPPGVLERGGAVGVEVAGALRAYEAWQMVARTSEPREQARKLLTAADDLAMALSRVRDQSAELLREREDRWRPAALRIASWIEKARPALRATDVCTDLKAAEKVLTELLDEVRAERWGPIADQARRTWDQLRQRSNVSVDDVALAGSGTKRRVEVKVTVDGVEGAALGVMSQGELHALALSLFLPRASLPESPFRFLLLDDPVQSMDPARVDGLARVLETAAEERQVVVFTHDDRLPEAVRRLGITARVVEVARGAESRVNVRETAAPWRRYLDDARALASSEATPELIRKRAVPGFCRMALEAAAVDMFRAAALGKGISHAAVDDALREATKLMPVLSLALFGTASRAGEVYSRLNRHGGWAADAVRACNEGSHGAFTGNPTALVKDVGDVIAKELGA